MMNQENGIPINSDCVTREWLTEVLHNEGVLQNSSVTSLLSEPVGTQGIISQVYRYRLGYDIHEMGQAPSLIIKFPNQDPVFRKNVWDMHKREISFYQDLSRKAEIPVPKYIYGAMDENTADNVLILEDVAVNSRPGCLVCGCSLEEAQAAVVHLARFHAKWWQREKLEQMAWLGHKRDYLTSSSTQEFVAAFEELLQRIHEQMPEFDLSPAFVRNATHLARNFNRVKSFLYNAPVTLIHDDYHLDNMAFRGSDTGTRPVIIDWQCIAKGPGVCDLGYFIAFCLSPEQRDQSEDALLNRYFSLLCEGGVTGYDFSRFLLDYRLSVIDVLERLVQVRFALDRSYSRGFEIFEATLNRLKPILEECPIVELIG